MQLANWLRGVRAWSKWNAIGRSAIARRRERGVVVSAHSEGLEPRTLLVPSLSVGDLSFVEGNNSHQEPYTHNLTVTLSETSNEDIYVELHAYPGTATNTGDPSQLDYLTFGETVRIPAGGQSALVPITTYGDGTPELDETFFMRVYQTYGGAATIADDEGLVTILNDDGPIPPTVSVEATHAQAAEKATSEDGHVDAVVNGEFTIYLSSTPGSSITVNYSISGTATNGTDYQTINSSVNVSGDTPISVIPIPDALADSPETVVLTLQNGTGYNVDSIYNTATVTLYDEGTLIFRPGECLCEATFVPSIPVTEGASLTHSNESASPAVTHFTQTHVSPNQDAANTSTPAKELLQLNIKNREGSVVASRAYYFNVTGKSVGDLIQMGVETDTSTLPTDVYQFEYTLRTIFADGTTSLDETVTLDEEVSNDRFMLGGSLNTAHRPDYGFGDGWKMQGLKTLNERDTGVPADQQGVWIDMGSGAPQWFKKTGTGTYESPDGFYGTLVKTGSTFTLTDKNFTRYDFNSSGLLLTEKDRNDRTTTYTYGINNRLEQITDSYGRSMTIAYNATTGLVSTVTDSDNRVTTYNFDSSTGRLLSYVGGEPDGVVGSGTYPVQKEFTYDAEGRITFEKTRENGVVKQNTEYVYDSRGRMTQEVHHDETVGTSEAAWDLDPVEATAGVVDGSDATAATLTNPAGLMSFTSLRSQTMDIATSHVLGKEYDWAGHLTRWTDSYGSTTQTTEYEYDPETHLLIKETLPTVTLAGGGTQTLEYDYQYDSNGNLTQRKTVSNAYAPGTEPTESWTYDSTFSQPLTYTDARGYVTVYVQDTYGNITKVYDPLLASQVADVSNPASSINTDFKFTEYAYFATGTAQAGLVQSVKTSDPDGSGTQTRSEQRYTYDTRGNLLTVVDVLPTGNLTKSFTYSTGTNRLRTVTNEAGKNILDLSSYMPTGTPTVFKELIGTANERKTKLTFDGLGNVVSKTLQDPDGAGPLTSPVYQYVYDARGRLTQEIAPAITVVLPDGTTTTSSPTTYYNYDLDGNLLSIVDPNGGISGFVYDWKGRLSEQHLPDPDGTGGQGETVITYGYDERDRVTSKVIYEPGASPAVELFHETYAYDPEGRLTAVTETLRDVTTKYNYDANGNLTAETVVIDATTEITTTYVYNSMNLLTEIHQPNPDPASTNPGPLWQYQYDQLGRLISAKDPLLHETKYEYDLRSQLTKITQPDPDGVGVGNPAPYLTYAYTNVGEVDKVTDHLGRITDYMYDDLSQLTRVDLPDPDTIGSGNPILSMSYVYDRLGRMTSQTDTRGQTTSYAYNAISWLTSTTLPDPDGASGSSFFGTNLSAPVIQYGYDKDGNLRTQDAPGPSGTLRTTNTYDFMGRLTSVIAPQAGSDTGATATTSYGYDAISRLKSVTDALTHATGYAYNPALGTMTVTDANNGQTVSAYDKVGNLVSLTDASTTNVTTFTYDQLNRRTSETTPFGKSIAYEYDFNGNLTKITDRYSPNGRKQEFTYDSLDRVTKETWDSATTGAAFHSISYAYDTAGRLANVKELRGNQAGSPSTEYVYDYDNLDRLKTVTDTANYGARWDTATTVTSLPVVLTYAYNSVGDLSSTSAAIATTAAPSTPVNDYVNTYQYDNVGRMTQEVQGGTAGTGQPTITRKRVDIAYNAAGQFSKIVRASGASGSETETATSTYSYFAGGGLKQIAHTHSGASSATTAPTGGSAISTYSWTYDTIDRVSSFTAPEGTLSYGYDNTSQLTSSTFTLATGYTGGTPSSESFNFDATGNRTGTGYATDHNRLTSDDTYNYAYDNEGNLYSRTEIATGKVQTYTWDHRNRLTRVEYRDSATGPLTKVVENTYDVYDHRVMKQVDTNGDGTYDRTERYVWDGDELALVLNENGNVLHRFLHGPSVDQIFADESSVDGLLWDLGDNQNTTRDVINNSGAVVNHLTYSSFGKITSESNSAKTPFFAYTGRDWDEDLNLQYNRARWFDPNSGRWLGEDPIRFEAGDPNLHRYVLNSPVNFTDPTGHEAYAHTESWRGESDGVKGTYYQTTWTTYGWTLFGNSWSPYGVTDTKVGPITFVPDAKEEHPGEGRERLCLEIRNREFRKDVSNAAGAVGQGLQAAGAVGAVVAGVLIPGPEDLALPAVQAALRSRGLAVVYEGAKRFIYRNGERLAGKQADEAAEFINDVHRSTRPQLVPNPKHHPNSKSPTPPNAAELYDRSIVDKSGRRWAKDADGIIHRFSAPSNGETHWNGSTAGPRPIRLDDVPAEIRNQLQ